MPLADGLKVRFWGVRGSISCSGAEYARYGGNTSCLEVTAGGRRLIFDAGTGIRPLGARTGAPGADRYRHLFHAYPPRPHLGPHLLRAAVRQGQFGAPVGGPSRGALYAEEGREQPDAGAALSGVARSLPGAGRVQGVQERPAARLRRDRDAHCAAQPSQRRHRLSRRIRRQVDLLHHRHRASRRRPRQDHRRAVPRRRRDDLRFELHRCRVPALPRLGPFDLAGGRAGGRRRGRRHARPSSITTRATTTPSWMAWRARRRWRGPAPRRTACRA